MLRAVLDQIRLTWRLIRDPRVPLWSKAIPVLVIAYVVSPLDFIPDVLIGLGQLDDLAIILGGMRLFAAVVPEDIVEQHRAELAGKPLEIIQGTGYTVKTDENPKDQ